MPVSSNIRWQLQEMHRNDNDKIANEDYVGIKDEVIPNASMSLEDIYSRIARGIPTDLYANQGQRLQPKGDFPANQRDEDLQSFRPYESVNGSLERMDEVQKRAESTIRDIQERKDLQSQEVETPIEEVKPDYDTMRKQAKEERKSK